MFNKKYEQTSVINSGIKLTVPHYDPANEANGRELFGVATGEGSFFAKKGSMVASVGNFKFEKRLLGTNDSDSFLKQVTNHIGRKLTGENIELMEVTGKGSVYLANSAQHVLVIDLDNGVSIFVESENLLAFTKNCYYSIEASFKSSIITSFSQKGLFTSKLTGNGNNAQVAITTNGNPLVIQTPCIVDPDALVAWTGQAPELKADVNFKTFIGQTSGESYQAEFKNPGCVVIIQPYERAGNNNYGDNGHTNNSNFRVSID